jgi:hypothetical protein
MIIPCIHHRFQQGHLLSLKNFSKLAEFAWLFHCMILVPKSETMKKNIRVHDDLMMLLEVGLVFLMPDFFVVSAQVGDLK